ncbi:unnamed protein product [Onchocerca ochengi]|uniref:GCP_C_terminal domain-containing protein n=1 Tax=Onchocerca ochengi TaxID=42157 RepID=A0A182ER74_ONCOC|nr:unnamed protein product [Onchocerca ochengi]
MCLYACYEAATVPGKQMSIDLVTLNERHLLEEMLHFLNAYNLHCSVYVVPRLWDIFLGKLSKSASLEEILSFQNSFFADTMAQCFLPDPEFMDLLSNLVTVIQNFTTDEVVIIFIDWDMFSPDSIYLFTGN